jgi:hypothetical protein
VPARALDGPSAWPRAIVVSLTAGLVWQAVLVAVLVRREKGSLRWPVVKQALWLRAPRSPRSGRIGGRVWWVLLPITVALVAKEMLPSLPSPDDRDLGKFLSSTAARTGCPATGPGSPSSRRCGSSTRCWARSCCSAVCSCRACTARSAGGTGSPTAVLFGLYHLHVPWAMYKSVLGGTFVLGYPVKRYGSAVLGIVVHSVQTVVFTGIVLALVLS